MLPLVSVIICTYNHAKYLPVAINSVLKQDYPNIEIVVVDDGSTDDTSNVVKQFPSIKYHYKQNQGLAKGRNTGIEISSGEYLLFLDADDWLLENAIATNAAYLNNNKEIAFVSGGHISVNAIGETTSIQQNKVEENHFEKLLEFNYIGMHATVMYRKWALDFYPFAPDLRGCDDYDSYLGVAAKYPIMHHTHLLAAYRKHDENMSGDAHYMVNTVLNILHKHAKNLTDPILIAAAKRGEENWKGYYANKEWKVLTESGFFEWSKKLKALNFIRKTKPILIKSYLYGNYRRKVIKHFLGLK
ncbi:MAG: family 2 glycosyl transferase [Chitinophaga sp.]|jgi:glycosyltransferase involved in cell wall biosynthesis|nr:family 2 glycosyl transferase [Chitinophaga sp.]